MGNLVIALPKGRILEEAESLLRSSGIHLPESLADSRKLHLHLEEAGLDLILAKPSDVPTFVEYGAADIGIVGKDVLLEAARDVYELLDLQIGRCRLSVAGLPEKKGKPFTRVATKYPQVASRHFRSKGLQVEVITMHGSIELAPLTGLADAIVDIVSTGRTLAENGLVEWEVIMPISSRLIANQVSYRMRTAEIEQLVARMEKEVEEMSR